MKKLLVVATAAVFLASCGAKTADDVKVEDIKDACGCVEAMNIIATDILDNIGDKTEEEVKEDEALKGKLEKLEKVGKKCRKDYEKEEAEKCDEFKELEKTMKKFEEKF